LIIKAEANFVYYTDDDSGVLDGEGLELVVKFKDPNKLFKRKLTKTLKMRRSFKSNDDYYEEVKWAISNKKYIVECVKNMVNEYFKDIKDEMVTKEKRTEILDLIANEWGEEIKIDVEIK
jgi:hypothetical protein